MLTKPDTYKLIEDIYVQIYSIDMYVGHTTPNLYLVDSQDIS